MMGPLGLLSPHPGVSYLFNGNETEKDEGSLWGIANAQTQSAAYSVGAANCTGPAGLSSPPPSWTPALAEMVLKVDGKFKVSTILILVTQELCLIRSVIRK